MGWSDYIVARTQTLHILTWVQALVAIMVSELKYNSSSVHHCMGPQTTTTEPASSVCCVWVCVCMCDAEDQTHSSYMQGV